MDYLTFNTRSNRVVIISSVITKIFFNPVQYRDGHISTCLIRTLVIYLCYAYCACASYIFVIVTRYLFICASYLLLSFIYSVHCSIINSFVVRFHSSSTLLLHSLFIVWKEKVQFWSWTVIRYFNPITCSILSYESINIIKQNPPTLS